MGSSTLTTLRGPVPRTLRAGGCLRPRCERRRAEARTTAAVFASKSKDGEGMVSFQLLCFCDMRCKPLEAHISTWTGFFSQLDPSLLSSFSPVHSGTKGNRWGKGMYVEQSHHSKE